MKPRRPPGPLARRLLGFRPTSTPGSNMRRLQTRIAWIVIALLAVDGALRAWDARVLPANPLTALGLVLLSMVYFAQVVVLVPFLTSNRFRPKPERLFIDAATSVVLNILCFSMLYRLLPLRPPAQTAYDAIYFSAVTFSTLGYGDFAPAVQFRLAAALQAILGNLHLGIIVGAAFFATQRVDPAPPPGRYRVTPRKRRR